MKSKSIFLDVDPSIMERNMTIIKDNKSEEELKNFLSSVQKPTKIIKPSPGFCVKSSIKPSNMKVFINVCHCGDIPAPKDIESSELIEILESDQAGSYRVPMSIADGRKELDKSGVPATVYDVAINSNFFKKIETDELFQSFFLTVVFEGLQDKYQFQMDMQNYVILKRSKSFGVLKTHKIQIRDLEQAHAEYANDPKPLIEEMSPEVTKPHIKKIDCKQPFTKFQLVREPMIGDIKQIIAEFVVSNMVKKNDIRLEVGEDRIIFEYEDNLADLFVPYHINQESTTAELDRNKQCLRVVMAASEA